MPSIQYGLSAFERAEGDLPQLPVINLYAEEAPTESRGVVLQSRPALVDRGAPRGSGPIQALVQADGVYNELPMTISGGVFYIGTTSWNTITVTGPCSIAQNDTGAMMTGGAEPWHFNGTTHTAVSFPDSANVVKVIEGASRFIALCEGSGKFYWTPPLGTTFDALDFATAESEPDALYDAVFIKDMLILGGSQSIEFWPNTGDSSLPFQPLEGAVINRGVKATGCMTKYDETFAWVCNDNTVRVGQQQQRISNAGLEEKIEASTSTSLWTFELEGQEFLALSIDAGTYVFGNRNRLWSQFQTYNQTRWEPCCYAGGIFGSSVDGTTFAWGDGYLDDSKPLERRFRAGFPLDAGGMNIANLRLRVNPGQTSYLTGDYANPLIEMRTSRDGGQTFGDWRQTSLGAQGNYRKLIEWRGLGVASRPGFLVEFRVTDPVPCRFSDVMVNTGFGGR